MKTMNTFFCFSVEIMEFHTFYFQFDDSFKVGTIQISSIVSKWKQFRWNECNLAKNLWHELQIFFNSKLSLPSLDLQSALFGFYENPTKNYIPNNVLLIFKLTLYKHRQKSTPTLAKILKNIKDREFLERKCAVSENGISRHNDKWALIASLL